MKALKHIRRASCLKVDQASFHRGKGTISVGNWEGTVVWGNDEGGWEHVSVSPYNLTITPSWDDMCFVKDVFFDDEETVLQFHPKKSQYVNLGQNCLHLWRPKNKDLLRMLEGMT